MSKFNFRLQPVLNLKSQEKKASLELYGKAQQSLQQRVKDLENLTERKEDYQVKMEKEAGRTIDPWERTAEWTYLRSLQKKIVSVNEDVNDLEDQVQERHSHFLGKLKEEKSLEKLKEVQKESHKEEQNRLLQKEMDEMAQQQYQGRKKEVKE